VATATDLTTETKENTEDEWLTRITWRPLCPLWPLW
jgi:hypothetical protein